MSYWEKCSKCGQLGKIDEEQKQLIGAVLIPEKKNTKIRQRN